MTTADDKLVARFLRESADCSERAHTADGEYYVAARLRADQLDPPEDRATRIVRTFADALNFDLGSAGMDKLRRILREEGV